MNEIGKYQIYVEHNTYRIHTHCELNQMNRLTPPAYVHRAMPQHTLEFQLNIDQCQQSNSMESDGIVCAQYLTHLHIDIVH